MHCRHAFGDQYRATDLNVPGAGKMELVFHPEDGSEPQHFPVHDFDGPGFSCLSKDPSLHPKVAISPD